MNGQGKSRGLQGRRLGRVLPVLLLIACVPVLDACSKSRAARRTTTTVAATSATGGSAGIISPDSTTMISSQGVTNSQGMTDLAEPKGTAGYSPAGESASRGLFASSPSVAAEDEEEGEEAALMDISPGVIGAGDQAGTHHSPPGLSGDALAGLVDQGDLVPGSAQSVLERIADAGGMKVFFSTNSIDRGLSAKRVDPRSVPTRDRAQAVDNICKQAGLSCFYAADFRSLSVYDPREFTASGPDMTALVYSNRSGFEPAGSARATAATVKPAKPGKPKPAASRPGKPKPAATKPGKPKPAATKPGKPKPSAGKPGKPKPVATKPAKPKPPTVKPKPASATKAPPKPATKPKK